MITKMFENHWSSGHCIVIQSRSSSGFKRTPKKVKHKCSYMFTFEAFSYKYFQFHVTEKNKFSLWKYDSWNK